MIKAFLFLMKIACPQLNYLEEIVDAWNRKIRRIVVEVNLIQCSIKINGDHDIIIYYL